MDNTRNQVHTPARFLLNAHMQAKMQQMFGNGYDSGDIEKGFDDPLILKEFKIGIGRSLTAPPSHTTWHTGPYQGGSVWLHVVVST